MDSVDELIQLKKLNVQSLKEEIMNIKNKIKPLILIVFYSLTSMAQVGIGTTTPNANAALDVVSNSQGILFPRMTTAQRDAIESPAQGLTIFNTDLNCIQTNLSIPSTPNWKCFAGHPSSNGTAVVSGYTCSTASAGTMTAGVPVSGVTQTITATVTTSGTYSISTTANGVTFAGSGTFAGTGAQNIVLTSTGTPTAAGSNTFTLNTTPTCSFSRTTLSGQPSSNGSAVVSGYTCSTASAGTMTAGAPVSGVTQTITATVTTGGTYSISTTANGVTFAGSGTFATTGSQTIVLTATGTPTAAGSNTFTLNTAPTCSFTRTVLDPSSNGTAVVSGYTCSAASAGNMILGVPVSGVTQTITATVTTSGTYSISTTANGVTFAGSGTFAGTGAQNIVLTSTGTPTAAGSNTFTLNTTPTCSFSRTTLSGQPSSNGSAVVSGYTCSTASAGTMTAGAPVSGVTQTITATVTTGGTYSISTTANGVTFAGSGTFATTGSQTIVLTATGTPTAAGSNTFTLNTTPNCSFSRTTLVPGTITLSAINPYFVASIYDQDYLPYASPTVAASLATAQAANGINETFTLNIQGSLTTTGVTIKIPYTVATNAVSLPAFSQTINVPASYTEDGIARDVTFSYSAAELGVGSGTINATLQAVGGTLNAKKLDLQTGLGNDNLGWLLAQFTYPTNSSGGTAIFQFRNIPGIPDRNIADAAHSMLYIPVLGLDGKTWLNNNLGANYSNITNGAFNPTQQAISSTDANAYGSLFQWGRGADGHELVNWSSGSAGTAVNAATTGQSSSTTPGSSFRIGAPNWYTGSNPDNLWQGVSGTNNPCPFGFRLPTETELNNQRLSWSSSNSAGAFASPLKLPRPSYRNYISGLIEYVGTFGAYWSNTVSSADARFIYFDSSISYMEIHGRASGYSVRCIKD